MMVLILHATVLVREILAAPALVYFQLLLQELKTTVNNQVAAITCCSGQLEVCIPNVALVCDKCQTHRQVSCAKFPKCITAVL